MVRYRSKRALLGSGRNEVRGRRESHGPGGPLLFNWRWCRETRGTGVRTGEKRMWGGARSKHWKAASTLIKGKKGSSGPSRQLACLFGEFVWRVCLASLFGEFVYGRNSRDSMRWINSYKGPLGRESKFCSQGGQ